MEKSRLADRERIVQEHVEIELRHDLEALVATFGDGAEWRDVASAETYHGHSGVRSFYSELFAGFPDFTFDVTNRIVSDEAVVLEAVAHGTHQGTWRGIPPTGRAVTFPLCAIFTFTPDDRIQAEIVYFDRLTVLTQLGVVS